MVYLDNPAGRLLKLLEEARAIPAHEHPIKAWGAIFRLSPIDTAQLIRKGARTIDLAAEVRRKVEALTDDDPGLILRNYEEVETVVERFTSIAALPRMDHFVSGLGPTGIHALEMCSSLLHRRSPEPVVENEKLNELRLDVAHLVEEFQSAEDFDADLRYFVTGHLFDILRALSDVDMTGVEPVRDEVSRIVGTMVTKRPFWRRLASDQVVAIVTVLAAIDAALGIGASLFQLTAHEETKVVVQIYNIATGCDVPEPEGPKIQIVPAGDAATDVAEVHDAELVDDEDAPAVQG